MIFISIILTMIANQQPDAHRGITPPAIPNEIRAVLEKNATLFSNLYISGTKSQRLLAPANVVLKTFASPESEADFTQKIGFNLRFQNVKYRETLYYPPGRFHSDNEIIENSFDGTKFYYGRHDPTNLRNPGLVNITTPALSDAESKKKKTVASLVYSEQWYLLESGFKGPNLGEEMGRTIESAVLERAAAGRVISVGVVGSEAEGLMEIVIEYPEPWRSSRTDSIENDPTLVTLKEGTDKLQMRIERERRDLMGKNRLCRFLLDSRMNYAVREKWESRSENNSLMFHTKNSEFIQVEPDGAWLPKRCEVDCYAYVISPLYISPSPLYKIDLQVDKIERKVFGPDDFRIWYGTAGVSIQDYTHRNATILDPYQYLVPSSADDLGHGPGRKWILIILINTVMIGVIAFVIYSRSRSNG